MYKQLFKRNHNIFAVPNFTYNLKKATIIPSLHPLPMFQLLNSDGKLLINELNGKDYAIWKNLSLCTEIYKKMLEWSIFDQLMNETQRQGRISFYMTSSGEEGVVFGSAAALDSKMDHIFPQYREGGVLYWRGYPLQSMVDQCFGNVRDMGKGRQMPVHYGSLKHKYYTVSSPLGTQITHAAGAGFMLRQKNQGEAVSCCYFGEGAASEGDFHAAINFASVLNSQTIFFCRNNGWAISTPTSEQYNGDGIVSRALGYGIVGYRVDGNDPLAVYECTKAARQICLESGKPVLIEAITYRLGHHSTSDDSSAYRNKDDVDEKNRNAPIKRLKNFLIASECWSNESDLQLKKSFKSSIIKMINDAETQPKADGIHELFTDVYDNIPEFMQEELEQLQLLYK